MPLSSGPNTVNDSIVFNYDIGDVANSYKGEPTTNLTPYSQDFSQWYGNLFGNWINSSVTVNASIAPDGTLTGNRFGDGYSRYTNSIAASTNTIYTFSVWLKNVSLTGTGVSLYWSFGLNGSLVTYGNGLSVGIGTLTGQWQRFQFSVTSPSSGINQLQFGIASFTGYGGNNSGQQFDAWGGQVEQKNHATQYLPTPTAEIATRSTTQGLLDISGNNNTITLTNMSYDNNAQPYFDGTDDYINLGSLNLQQNWTLEAICYMNDNSSFGIFGQGIYGTNQGLHILYQNNSRGMIFGMYSNDNDYQNNYRPVTGKWYHWVFTYNAASYTKQFYADSVLQTAPASVQNIYQGSGQFNVGAIYSAALSPANGKIQVAKMYNRVLTATEIRNNYLQYKTRFNLS